jgi:myo-inositol-1(or 4)-monophosphatase
MNDLSCFTLVAIQAALLAGNLLKSGFRTSFQIQEKEGTHNLVTEYDFKSEESILSSLKQAFPSHGFLSEEKGEMKNKTSSIVWIIDPLDGTVNFAHEIPHFCVSIAATKQGHPLLGIVFQPMTNELFVAEKGKGAFLNGKPLSVSKTDDLANSFLATGFPYNLQENPHQCKDRFCKVMQAGIPLRRLGSAALDLAYVAAGRFDGFWEVHLAPWDVAAGVLLVEESKGRITSLEGDALRLEKPEALLASNGKIHESLLSLLHVGKKEK